MPKSKVKKVIVPKLNAETIKKLEVIVEAEELEIEKYDDQMESELNQAGLDDIVDEELSKQLDEELTNSKDLKSTRRDA